MVRPKALSLFTKQLLIDTGAGKTGFHRGEEMKALFAGQGVVAVAQSRGTAGGCSALKHVLVFTAQVGYTHLMNPFVFTRVGLWSATRLRDF